MVPRNKGSPAGALDLGGGGLGSSSITPPIAHSEWAVPQAAPISFLKAVTGSQHRRRVRLPESSASSCCASCGCLSHHPFAGGLSFTPAQRARGTPTLAHLGNATPAPSREQHLGTKNAEPQRQGRPSRRSSPGNSLPASSSESLVYDASFCLVRNQHLLLPQS